MPFETVALDFITKLPMSQGYNSILTVMDHDCSKAAIFIPCKEAITAEEMAGLIIRHIFPRFGLPQRFRLNERQDNWHSYLPLAKFTHNNWPNETTGESPFFILYGFNLRTDWIDKPSPIPQVALRVEKFQEARQKAQTLMIKVQQSWIRH